MELRFEPRGVIGIDDARLIFKNFSGKQSEYNREGDRNFAVIIPDDMADRLREDGWNVKIKQPNNPDIEPYQYLPVKIKFSEYGPLIKVISGRNVVTFDEELVGQLDRMDILKVDLDLRPYDWESPRFGSGRTAYLQKMYVTQNTNTLDARYADLEYPEE